VEGMPVSIYNSLRKGLPEPGPMVVDDIVAEMRIVKSESELRLIKEATRLSNLGFETLLETAEEGMWGYEVVAKMEQAVRSRGADFARFWMASGPGEDWRAFRPDFVHERRLRRGDQVVLSSYVMYRGYWTQQMRAGTLGGRSRQQKKLFEICHEIENVTIEAMRPGIPISNIVKKGRATAEKAGYAIYGGRIGHGMGLDYGERPFLVEDNTTRLRPGMVVVIHPPITTLDTGGWYIAVGDLCLVTDDGVKILTDFPRELFQI